MVMIDINKVIEDLNNKVTNLRNKLEKRRLDMGDQDNSNVSRYITATRWAVEQEIEAMDKELVRIGVGIKELKKLGGEKNRYYDKYFVADVFEYLSLGIISKKTGLGQDILKRNADKIGNDSRNTNKNIDQDFTK